MTQTIQNQNATTKPVTITRNRTSKKEKARELYIKYHTEPRAQIIQRLIVELDMPENSARTYVSTCAKELNPSLGKEFKTRTVTRLNLKRQRAFEIYSANADLGRKAIIELLKVQLGMSHNSAATHCSIAAKEFRATQTV